MKVLIVGSGGREHAIAWAVSKSAKADKIYCAPGNAGIEEYAECVNIGAMEFDKLVAFAKEKEIDLTIIGMDDPLVGGVVDAFEAEGLRVFGPRKNAAIIEGSKAFSKDLMKKYNIPTAIFPMPVIGIPMKTSDLGGVDSLYSIVQMPTGIPVATVAINGAANAGILAAKMLATSDPELLERLKAYSEKLKNQVVAKADKLEEIGYEEYLKQM